MKRSVAALVLLLAALLAVIFGRARILSLCDELRSDAEETIALASGDIDSAVRRMDEFIAYCENNETLLNTFVRRELTEEMLSCAHAASAYGEQENKLDFICEAERTIAAINAIKSSYERTI